MEFHDRLAAGFLRQLLALPIGLAIITIDPSLPTHVDMMDRILTRVNTSHAAIHRRHVSRSHFGYALVAPSVLMQLWGFTLRRFGARITLVDACFDRQSLPRTEREDIESAVRESAAVADIVFGRLEWAARGERLALAIPDLVAGVVHRQLTRGDCPEAFGLLQQAEQSGRIGMQLGRQLSWVAPEDRATGQTETTG